MVEKVGRLAHGLEGTGGIMVNPHPLKGKQEDKRVAT